MSALSSVNTSPKSVWPAPCRQALVMMVGPVLLVYRYGALMSGIVFYVGRLIMANSTFAREALMMVVARRTPVRHPFVLHDGIKKPHRSAAHH